MTIPMLVRSLWRLGAASFVAGTLGAGCSRAGRVPPIAEVVVPPRSVDAPGAAVPAPAPVPGHEIQRVSLEGRVVEPRGVAITPQGDTWVVGSFYVNMVVGGVKFDAAGKKDGFVLRLGERGDLRWSAQFRGSEYTAADCVAVGPGGEVAVTVAGTESFRVGATPMRHPSVVVLYAPDGAVRWLREMDGGAGRLAFDPDGNVLVAGDFYQRMSVGPWTLKAQLHPGEQPRGGFLVKLGPTGEPVFASSFDAVVGGVAVDARGNIAVAGSFRRSFTVGATRIDNSDPIHEDSNAFVAKFDRKGTPFWARRLAGGGGDAAFEVAFDHRGDLFITGAWTDGAPAGKVAILAKLDERGASLWTQYVRCPGQISPRNVAVDADGAVLVTGRCWPGPLDLGPITVDLKGDSGFLEKVRSDGAVQWGVPLEASEGMAVAALPGRPPVVVAVDGRAARVTWFTP
jgi:hypothetical protein